MKQHALPQTVSCQKPFLAFLLAITLLIFAPRIVASSFAETTTLAWDANSESDLAGYKIHYSTSSANGPFDGTDLSQGASPITLDLSALATPGSPFIQLSGLAAGETYYFAVSAYNDNGIESDFSNIISHTVPLPVTYSITASVSGPGAISPSGSVSVLDGSSKAYIITADDNHHIADVIVDGASVGPVQVYSFENINAAHSIQAVFEIDTYSITASANGNGTISPEGTTSVNVGSNQTYAITPDKNHHVADVTVNGTSVGPVSTYTFTNINTDHTIQAEIEIDTFSITASAGENGKINPNGNITAAFGTSRTFAITPDENYLVKDIIIDGISKGSSDSITFDSINASHTVQVDFEIKTLSISTFSYGSGTISPNGPVQVAWGSDQVCSITPKLGYQIEDVYVDGKSIGAVSEYTFSNVAENHIIEASFSETINEFSMEVGEVSVGSDWQRVPFNKAFVRPVVVASSLSTNDDAPAVVRIDNVTPTGFEISIQEWDYLDDAHMLETVSYVVMEAGKFTLSNGTVVEAGILVTDGKSSFSISKLGGAFTQIPVVIASVISYNDPDAVTIRLQNISREDFEYRVQEQEANIDSHPSETVSYIAWEPCRIDLDGIAIEVAKTTDSMNDEFKTVTFSQSFPEPPLLVASMQTTDGKDAASIRWIDLSNNGVKMKVAEESSKDAEIFHTSEVVGYFSFASNTSLDTDQDGLADIDENNTYKTDPNLQDTDSDGITDGNEASYWGANWDADFDNDTIINILDPDADGDQMLDGDELANGYDPGDATSKPYELPLEYGEVSVNQNWQKVSFTKKFSNPVVVASSLSKNGSDPSTVRISNITSTGFEISVQEWDYLDGRHTNETIGYVVMETGRFILPDGTVLLAGSLETDGTLAFRSIGFTEEFTRKPIVVASITSYNDPDTSTVRLRNISTTRFEYQVQEQEVNTDGHSSETISYIAWEPCRIVLDGLSIEVADTGDIMDETSKTITFIEPFAEPPVFVASIQTTDGGDTASLRWTNRSNSAISVNVEEEQSNDTEMSHTTEAVGYFSFSND